VWCRYYYGLDALMAAHPDIITILCNKVRPDVLVLVHRGTRSRARPLCFSHIFPLSVAVVSIKHRRQV
jgi:hypothetical protein